MARTWSKACTKCGRMLGPEMYYRQGRNGGLDSRCKECKRKIVADRKRLVPGEYRTIKQVVADAAKAADEKRKHREARPKQEWEILRDIYDLEWVSVACEGAQTRSKEDDAWKRYCTSVSSTAKKRFAKPNTAQRQRTTVLTWRQMAVAQAKSSRCTWKSVYHSTRGHIAMDWRRKMETTARNWRRKSSPSDNATC